MLVSFEQLPDHSRIWIYQAERLLNLQEQEYISKELSSFLADWMAHGHQLQSGFKLEHKLFLILGLNEEEAEATGCSIDKSVALLRDFEEKLQISFFERNKIALYDEVVHLVSLNNLKKRIELDEIEPQQQFFDNTIKTKGELRKDWIKTLENSWMRRYFEQKAPIS
jgi:hypothetical protein